jgi:hypothetical protein
MTSLIKLEWLFIGLGMGITLGEEDLVIFLFGMGLLISGFGLEFYNENQRHKQIQEDFNKQYKTKSKRFK